MRGRGGRALRHEHGVPLLALRHQGAWRQLPGVQAPEAPLAARVRGGGGGVSRVQQLLRVHGRLRGVNRHGASVVEGGGGSEGSGAAVAERRGSAGGMGEADGIRGRARMLLDGVLGGGHDASAAGDWSVEWAVGSFRVWAWRSAWRRKEMREDAHLPSTVPTTQNECRVCLLHWRLFSWRNFNI